MADQCVDTYLQKRRQKEMHELHKRFSIKSSWKSLCKVLEKSCRETHLQDAQCRFCPGRSTMDQIFTFQQVFEKSGEYSKEVYTCLINLEKAYDHAPRDKLWAVLMEYDVRGLLFADDLSLLSSNKSDLQICT